MLVFNPAALDHIRTRFVRDRLRETSFSDRAWIAELLSWEATAADGGPVGWASHVGYGQTRHAHPVECECILRELRTGEYTPPSAYRDLLRTKAEADEQERREAERKREERCAAERLAWREAGGRE